MKLNLKDKFSYKEIQFQTYKKKTNSFIKLLKRSTQFPPKTEQLKYAKKSTIIIMVKLMEI
jgi:glycosylphosphatidylinositol transamidase (GPIT) subunit GPI8